MKPLSVSRSITFFQFYWKHNEVMVLDCVGEERKGPKKYSCSSWTGDILYIILQVREHVDWDTQKNSLNLLLICCNLVMLDISIIWTPSSTNISPISFDVILRMAFAFKKIWSYSLLRCYTFSIIIEILFYM